jgi:hypothetical protein
VLIFMVFGVAFLLILESHSGRVHISSIFIYKILFTYFLLIKYFKI